MQMEYWCINRDEIVVYPWLFVSTNKFSLWVINPKSLLLIRKPYCSKSTALPTIFSLPLCPFVMEKQQQEEEPLSLNSDLKKQETVLCEECKEKPSKYKCPGCSVRSCSLNCVKAHKQRASCSGKRSQTHFVPLSQFDDNLLLSGTSLSLPVSLCSMKECLLSLVCGRIVNFPCWDGFFSWVFFFGWMVSWCFSTLGYSIENCGFYLIILLWSSFCKFGAFFSLFDQANWLDGNLHILMLPAIDYNLLEEIKRVADSARRTRTKLHPHPPYSRFPPHRQDLKRAAARRRTKLLFLPNGMSKREKNQTQYDPRFVWWKLILLESCWYLFVT